ncbi:MAG: riboflavin biosynthesis protein RibF [Clostridia bacterium]|nr:riboflavin biosynthesis protein RibF [Clostridia bacterium]
MAEIKRAVALGNFDGLHKGHTAVIENAAAMSRHGFKPCVLLLDPLPCNVEGFTPHKALITDSEKEKLLSEMGVEVVKIDFLKIKDYEPERFFEDIIIKKLNAGALSCGFNYRFGKDGRGDSTLLESLCKAEGIAFCASEAVEYEGLPISSTRIRSALENGEIEKANAMLGRAFGYTLRVVHGDKIGRLLDCPTINQLFPEELIVPKYGVYSSEAEIDGKWLRSVTNIGRRPSFENDEQRSETHIIGYNGNLYGKTIEVRLLSYKRGERKFSSLDELKEQLSKDKA